MRQIRTSGSMSGDGKRGDARVATAPTLDSTENKGPESAGINRQEAENESFSRGRGSDPLGPEFCAGRREAHSEA